MPFETKRLRTLRLTVGDSPDEITFEAQVKTYNINNNTEDGDKLFSFETDPDNPIAGEVREETEPDWTLHLEMYPDWRSAGWTKFVFDHDGETLAWELDIFPLDPLRHWQFSGRTKVKAPSIGGEARTTEMHTVDWPIIGKPEYLTPDDLS